MGCGGGILSEGLARLGADVTGIDVVPENVHVAAAHAQRDPFIRDRIQYRHVSAEELAAEGARFDAVIASEVIEHVKRPSAFAKTLAKLAEPGKGLVFISTLDRSNKSVSFLARGYVPPVATCKEPVSSWTKSITHVFSSLLYPAR